MLIYNKKTKLKQNKQDKRKLKSGYKRRLGTTKKK